MASGLNIILGAFVLILSVLSSVNGQETCPEKVVFCYYSSWSIYRPSFGSYKIDDIDPELCTHLVYAFAGLNLEGLTFSLDPYNDLPEAGGNQQYYYFRMLKEKNPCLKVLLSIGGWDEGSEKYSVMSETAESRDKFVDHLLRYIVYYGFDGIDLDWEYPGDRGGIAADRTNYAALLSDISKRFKPRGKLICVAVGAASRHVSSEGGYDVAELSKHVDYVLMMTYDYHRNDVTSHVAPLVLEDSESVEASIKMWLDKGCPPNKLVLGVLASGRTFKLADPEKRDVGDLVSGPGDARPFTGIPGFISYYEMCDTLIEDSKWVETYGPNDDYVYATNGTEWATYEDVKTITRKAEYAVEKGLGGVMVYSIDTDDFRGFCNEDKNMIQVIVNNIVLAKKK